MNKQSEEPFLKTNPLLAQLAAVPKTVFALEDLWLIFQALKGYSACLLHRRDGGSPSSQQRVLLHRMQEVRRKMIHNLEQARAGKAVTDGFAFEDVEIMVEGLDGFCQAISKQLPASKERQQTLSAYRSVKERLEKLLDEMVAFAPPGG
jgi:hypothetical protein